MKAQAQRPDVQARGAWGQRSKDLVIVLALLGAGFLLGWLRLRPQLASAKSFSAGQAALAAGDPALRYAAWQPRGDLGAPAESGAERAPAVSPDGRYLVFQVGERGRGADLFVARLERGPDGLRRGPSRPLPGPFGPADELAPAFVGSWLYFASNRPGGAGGFDLYRARFDEGEASLLEHLPEPWNSAADELDPSAFGSTGLLFSSTRHDPRGRDHDLYLGSFEDGDGPLATAAALQRLEALCSPFDEREPRLSPGGQALWFASDRPGGAGGFDLYRALEQGGRFVEAQAVRPLNGPGAERAPLPLGRGFELLFDRAPEAGEPRLQWAESEELFARPSPPPAWREILALSLLLLLALLAWLAKRWRAMDVLYRCYVISLLAHLLLLWGARGLRSSEGSASESRGTRLSVRLVADDPPALEARGGQLGLLRGPAGASGPAAAQRRPSSPRDPLGETADPAASLALEPAPALPSAALPEAPLERAARRATSKPQALELAALSAEPRRPSRAEEASALALEPSALGIAAGPRFAFDAPPGPARRPLAELPADPLADRPAGPSQGTTLPGERLAPLRSAPDADGAGDLPKAAFARVEPDLARGAEAFGRAADLAVPAPAPAPLRSAEGPRSSEGGAAEPGGSVAAWSQLADAVGTARRRDSAPGAPAPRFPHQPRPDPLSRGPLASAELAVPLGSAELGSSAGPASAGAVLGEALAEAGASARFDGRRGSARALDGLLRPAPGDDGSAAEARARAPASVPGPATTRRDGAELAALSLGPPLNPRRFERRAPEAASAPALRVSAAWPDLPAPQTPRMETAAPRERDAVLASEPEDWRGTPFQSRRGSARAEALSAFGGDQRTEDAVARGLAYLASIQDPQGFWGDGQRFDPKYGYVCVGNTGLALLAFLGAGHTPGAAGPYAPTVERAIDFLLAVQGQRSGHFGDTGPYSHAIATYALAEAYALERDPRLRAPIEAATRHLLAAQDRRSDPRRQGGWGYFYPELERGQRGDDGWPRTSVSAWCVMALESARLGGIEVPDAPLDAARGFFERAFDPGLGAFRYSHDPERLRSSWPTLPASTPAALFVLGLFGADLGAPEFAPARDFIQRRMPLRHARVSDDAFVRRGQGNLYFIYYATLASFRIGGSAWERWNAALKDTLLPAQRADGSWEPICTYALDYAGDTDEQSVYTTALAVLSLEVYYRYFTPLLRVEAGLDRRPGGEGSGRAAPALAEPASLERRDL
jgi:hypothetical protein